MVSREDRDTLIEILDKFTGEESKTGDFLQRIYKLDESTNDQMVSEFIEELDEFTDGMKNKTLYGISKEGWDYLKRIRLLLKTDAEFETKKTRHWMPIYQSISLILFITEISIFYNDGYTFSSIFAAIIFGLIIYFISGFRSKSIDKLISKQPEQNDYDIYPFIRYIDIVKALHITKRYRKIPCPDKFRTIKKKACFFEKIIGDVFGACGMFLGLALLSPFTFLYFALPFVEVKTKLVYPKS